MNPRRPIASSGGTGRQNPSIKEGSLRQFPMKFTARKPRKYFRGIFGVGTI